MCTQAHSFRFNSIHALKGIYTNSSTFNCIQWYSIAFNICSQAFTWAQACSSMLNCIQIPLMTFMHTQLHVGISSKALSVAFRLAQRHSPAPNCIKLCLWNTHLHSLTLNHVQLLSIEVNIWFMHTQTHSGVVSLNGIQSGQKNKSPMDMCSNMGSMEIWHRFALSIPWMLFKVWWLYWCEKRRMNSNFDIGEKCSSTFCDYTDLLSNFNIGERFWW